MKTSATLLRVVYWVTRESKPPLRLLKERPSGPAHKLRSPRAPSRAGWYLNYLYLSVQNFENLPTVVDMSQNEVQVPKLTGPPQEIDAAAAKTGTGRSVSPTADNVRGLPARGPVSSAHQSSGNPRAADLVFFPELTLASGAYDGNASVTLCQVSGENGVIAKGPQIDGFTAGCFVNQFGARRRNQNQRPMGIVAIGELGRAVFNFEDNRRCTLAFTGEKGIGEFLRNRQGRFNGRSWKAAPPGCRSRDRRGGGTYDIDGDNRPSRPISARAFG